MAYLITKLNEAPNSRQHEVLILSRILRERKQHLPWLNSKQSIECKQGDAKWAKNILTGILNDDQGFLNAVPLASFQCAPLFLSPFTSEGPTIILLMVAANVVVVDVVLMFAMICTCSRRRDRLRTV